MTKKLLAACLLALGGLLQAAGAPRTLLATTFPVYQVLRNVAAGREGVRVELLLPGGLGCPHDYALKPQDMQKLARAEVLVVNGLGLEEFLGAPVQRANPRIAVLDSSAGIADTLPYACEGHDHGHGHAHPSQNPHLFASPRMQARLARGLAAQLGRVDPKGAALYARNAQGYARTMERLADEAASLGRRLKNNRVVQPHGVFDYLARDLGLDLVASVQSEGREPSAQELRRLVKLIRARRAGAIVVEPQYPDRVGRMLSKETGVPVVQLDPGATGPENAPLNYAETLLRRNLAALQGALGVR